MQCLTEGMNPRIQVGDIIHIDPTQQLFKSNAVYLFKLSDIKLELGMLQETPRGFFIHFMNQSAGWEPIQIELSQCVGQVVFISPLWVK